MEFDEFYQQMVKDTPWESDGDRVISYLRYVHAASGGQALDPNQIGSMKLAFLEGVLFENDRVQSKLEPRHKNREFTLSLHRALDSVSRV